MNGLLDLLNFVHAATRGICVHQDAVTIASKTNGPTITLIISCHPDDLKFVYCRLNALSEITKAIAKRHKQFAHLVVDDGVSGEYIET